MRRLVAFCAVLGMAVPAAATVTTQDYSFTTSTTGPVNPSGTFQLSFDDVTNLYSLTQFNMILGATTFTTANTAAVYPFGADIVIGDTTPTSIMGGTSDDFILRFNPATPNTITGSTSFDYALSGVSDLFNGTPTLTRTDTPAVPEPATWAMMLIGFGGIGFSMRRRRSWMPAFQLT